MTCIVGLISKGDVYLGGDRAATSSDFSRTIIKTPKVFIKNNVAFGVCGTPKSIDVLTHVIDVPTQVAGTTDQKFVNDTLIPAIKKCFKKTGNLIQKGGESFFNGELLVGYRSSLYRVQCDFSSIVTNTCYDAIGSGGSIALGSLASSKGDTRRRVLAALEASAQNNASVAPPFDVVVLKK